MLENIFRPNLRPSFFLMLDKYYLTDGFRDMALDG